MGEQPGARERPGALEQPGPREESPRLAAEAWESLFRAQSTLMKRFERAGDFAPLRAREYDVLFTLSRAPDGRLRLRDLNEEVFLSQPSLSRMVDRMETRGLLRREPAPDDARGVVVGLTQEGAAVQRRIGRRHVRTIAQHVGAALTEPELRTLLDLTTRLRAAQRDGRAGADGLA